MKIIIVGGGKTGTFLAERLTQDHDVIVVEQRVSEVEELNAMLPDVDVIAGDACEPEVLEAAGAAGADVVVAATGDDEDNLVVAMLAKVLGKAKVYSRVNHPRNEWLFDKEWGVDVAVSSPTMLYGLIGKDLSFGDLITLLDLRGDDVTVEEFRLPPTAEKIGAMLSEVALPSNVTVMAVLGEAGGVHVARGETVLSAGDQLLLLAEGELDEAVIRTAFGVSG